MAEQEKLTKKLQLDVAKTLKAHMPEFVCGVVKDRLEAADKMERELDIENKNVQRLQEVVAELQAMKLDAERNVEERDSLYAATAELREDRATFERDKQVFELTIKLGAAQVIADNATQVAMGLVRNIEYRKNVFNNKDMVDQGHTDNQGYHTPASKNGMQVSENTNTTEGAD